VLLDARESTNRVKESVIKELFSEIRGFSREEWVMYDISQDISQSKDIENLNKNRRNLKNMVMRNFWALKWNFFIKKPQKSWSVKFFPPPQFGDRSPPFGLQTVIFLHCMLFRNKFNKFH